MAKQYISKEIDKKYISEEIIKKAITMCDENFWSYLDALQVAAELSKSNLAIVGVELYERINNYPKWIATSNYNYDKLLLLWDKFAEFCNKSAIEFIKSNKDPKNILFNFSYVYKGEIEEIKKRKRIA